MAINTRPKLKHFATMHRSDPDYLIRQFSLAGMVIGNHWKR